MKLNNTSQVRAEDFADDEQQMITKLGSILNPFMQQVVELSDGRIDFENLSSNVKTFEITVNSNGVPTLSPFRVNVGVDIIGTQVIRAYNLTSPTKYVTAAPFVSFTPLGGGLIRVDNITGLEANNKYQITMITY